jgi:hypothetical protein
MCADCTDWLAGRRRLATVVTVLVFVVAAGVASLGGTAGLVALGLLGLYILRTATYNYVDAVLFGDELEEGFGERVPRHADGSRESVRFPGGVLGAMLRVVSAATLGFAVAFTAAVIFGGERSRGGSIDDTLELLSRPAIVYFPLVTAGDKWTTREVEGDRAAIGYTSWEALPPGEAMQMSPHDAFERAMNETDFDAIAFDPGKEVLVVPRKKFGYFKLHLPLWPTPTKVVTKR